MRGSLPDTCRQASLPPGASVPRSTDLNRPHTAEVTSVRAGPHNRRRVNSQTAVVGLSRNAALAHAADNIRVNALCPGHVDTPFIRGSQPHSENTWSTDIANPDNYARRMERQPLAIGRLQSGEDIAYGALYLASDESSTVTGATIAIDGGSTLL